MSQPFREVIRDHRFERNLRALIREAVPADRFVEAAESLLARDPLIGSPTDDERVWFLPMAPVEGKQVALYDAFDDSRVWLLAIERSG